VNRVALHQSVVRPLDPVALVDVAHRAGLDSVGLHVAAAPGAEQWWSHGIGSPMLRALVDALLSTRVTVLDVGRVPLGPELCVADIGHPYGRVLDLGNRLGAQFVTVRAGAAAHDPAEFFARLVDLAEPYQLRPLLAPTAGTAVATVEQAVAVVDGTGGGVVLDVAPGRDTAESVDETVVELGAHLGYVRVPADGLPQTAAPGLLATLPPHVPVAIGSTPVTDDAPTSADPAVDHVGRAVALRAAVDALLRHPRAAVSP
jgi:sugar phosphate isomerase/epimerase